MNNTIEVDYMLTTTDNPFDPFTQFDAWYAEDIRLGYHTCELLGRIARTSSELPDSVNDAEISQAMLSIIANDLTGKYIRVSRTME